MSVTINYSKNSKNKLSGNIVLFVNEKFNTSNLNKHTSKDELSYINDLLKNHDLKKNILVFELNSKKKIILISVKKELKSFDIENLGAELYNKVNYEKKSEYLIIADSLPDNKKNFVGFFLHGLRLKAYEFNKYKTKTQARIEAYFEEFKARQFDVLQEAQVKLENRF